MDWQVRDKKNKFLRFENLRPLDFYKKNVGIKLADKVLVIPNNLSPEKAKEDTKRNYTSRFKINWEDKELASKREWELGFTSTTKIINGQVVKNDFSEIKLLNITKNANYLKFGQQTFLEGGKTYQLDFNPNDKEIKGRLGVGLFGGMMLLFLML